MSTRIADSTCRTSKDESEAFLFVLFSLIRKRSEPDLGVSIAGQRPHHESVAGILGRTQTLHSLVYELIGLEGSLGVMAVIKKLPHFWRERRMNIPGFEGMENPLLGVFSGSIQVCLTDQLLKLAQKSWRR